ncbi:hypothetical protein Acr_00g0006330 [Actinidia rufa]|uniref:Retrovirus-related Pol polyprotein from transposon TNT 1-94-like beta-barrel domain-containing protein n=1 Tax=Actinidia rufa TaxID=165716 RepID=A0A7J0D9T5_9ERIC|nr:hypothetical protein Acr_00g0006330 [Actinidia rufa]
MPTLKRSMDNKEKITKSISDPRKSTYNPSPHSAFTAAQTLNPTATNAATTPNLCAANNQPLCNQQPAATPVQPAATPCSPVLHSPCAATPVQPAAQSSSHPPCAANSQQTPRATQPQPRAAQSARAAQPATPQSYPVLVSLSHSQPTQRVTSVLLNGKNFYAWSRSFQLYPSGKCKTRWILEKEPKPEEAPTALHGKSGHPTWILDSGANNYMTGELATFTSPVTSVNQSVCIADGSSIPIRSQGDARLSSDITLSSVLSYDPIPPRPLPILEPPSSPFAS